jgi:hypothetical protein
MYHKVLKYARVFNPRSVIRADSFTLSWLVFAIIQFVNVLTKRAVK